MNANLSARLTLPLLTLVVFNLLPAFLLRPVGFVAFSLGLLAARAWIHWRELAMPPRWILWSLQASAGLLIFRYYGTIFGDEASGSLLMLLACLKTFELSSKRDFFVVGLLCQLVVMSYLLSDQSLTLTFFLLVDLALTLALFQALEDDFWEWKGWRSGLKPVLLLMLKSAPVMVLIFVMFPRFSTGFGASDKVQGKTGVTDHLRPGSVSQLVRSDELVFRATFLKSDLPPRQQLYWRAAVLDRGMGLDWDRSPPQTVTRAPLSAEGGDDIEVYAEPGYEKFLFTLENTRTVNFPNDLSNSRVLRREEGIFELQHALQNRERYFLQQVSEAESAETAATLKRYLTLAEKPSSRMLELTAKWKDRNVADKVRGILSHFHEGGYEYSLQPPISRTVEDFLFQNKSGFCEHYAGAMAHLLRQMGVPARVVVGFQGGTPSLLGNYITVRGHDAHAWVEYFDGESQRWRRVDPTAQVAPARLTEGSEMYMEATGEGFFSGELGRWWRQSQRIFDEVEAHWIGFLVRFDLARQKELLARLGMEEVLFRALPVFLLLSLVLILAIFYFFEAQRAEPLPEEERLYRRLLKVLKRFNVDKSANEGPLALMKRLEATHPELADHVRPILSRLVEARFSLAPRHAEDLRDLRKRIDGLSRSSHVS